jgi:hypothetical protein
VNCCCCWILYNQPDFINVPSKLERLCKPQGYQIIFLLKFYCELNLIEQCWGYSKWLYCQYLALSKEANLKCNVLTALDSVPLVVMQWSVLPLSCQWLSQIYLISHTVLPLVHIVLLMRTPMVSKGRVQHGLPRNIEVIESCQSLFWTSLIIWRKQERPERCYI